MSSSATKLVLQPVDPHSHPSDRHEDESIVPVRGQDDLGVARMFAREACKIVGIRGYTAQKIVTAVGELARNLVSHAGRGWVRFRVDPHSSRVVVIAEDRGPGIPRFDELLFALDGHGRPSCRRGLIGVKRLADEFDIQTSERGTRVEVAFYFGDRRD